LVYISYPLYVSALWITLLTKRAFLIDKTLFATTEQITQKTPVLQGVTQPY